MLQELNLPNSLKDIENSAFELCELLNITSLPINIKSIGKHAFYKCNGFEGTIPANIESLGISPFPPKGSFIKSLSPKYSIQNGLLINNSKLAVVQSLQAFKEFDIPENVVSIEDYAFSYSEIESIIIPSNIKSIGDFAFCGCKHLKYFEFNNSVKQISKYMFSGCENLKEIQ